MITLSQKKCCGSCRALLPSSKTCSLGYATEYGKRLFGVVVGVTPSEPCPKPLTVSDSLEAIRYYRNS